MKITPNLELTEEPWHEADAVGEHGALDDIQVGQHGVDEEGGPHRVQNFEQHHHRHIHERGTGPFLKKGLHLNIDIKTIDGSRWHGVKQMER